MNNPYLIGEKIYLRALESEDAMTIQPWVNDPEVNQYMLLRKPADMKFEQQFIDGINKSDKDLVLVIVRRDVDQPVGVTGFHQINYYNRNAVFGIAVGDKDVWGMGFGTEATALMMTHAFNSMNLHRVTLQVFTYNERAIHIYEKLGFQREGMLRDENYRHGQYWDTIVMGLLRADWEAIHANRSDAR